MSVFDSVRLFIVSMTVGVLKFFVISLELFDRQVKRILIASDLKVKNVSPGKSENGSTRNGTNSLPHTPPSSNEKRTKRIKLFVDISVSPGGSSKVLNVSTRDVMDEAMPSRPTQLLSKCGLAMLWGSRRTKNFVLNRLFQISDVSRDAESPSERKMISPRRRVSPYKKLIPQFPFRLLGIREPMSDSVTITPNVQTSEESRFKRAQSMEKRKRAESSSTSEEEFMVVDECEAEDVTVSENGQLESNENVPKVNGDVQETSTESDTNASSQDVFSSPMSQTQKMLDTAEEDYDSAEDPDFEPNTEELAADSSTEDSDISDADPNELRQEVLALCAETNEINKEDQVEMRLDAAQDGVANPENQHQPPHNADVHDQPARAIIDGHHNEVEYTNGQVSIRELMARNQSINQEAPSDYLGSK